MSKEEAAWPSLSQEMLAESGATSPAPSSEASESTSSSHNSSDKKISGQLNSNR